MHAPEPRRSRCAHARVPCAASHDGAQQRVVRNRNSVLARGAEQCDCRDKLETVVFVVSRTRRGEKERDEGRGRSGRGESGRV